MGRRNRNKNAGNYQDSPRSSQSNFDHINHYQNGSNPINSNWNNYNRDIPIWNSHVGHNDAGRRHQSNNNNGNKSNGRNVYLSQPQFRNSQQWQSNKQNRGPKDQTWNQQHQQSRFNIGFGNGFKNGAPFCGPPQCQNGFHGGGCWGRATPVKGPQFERPVLSHSGSGSCSNCRDMNTASAQPVPPMVETAAAPATAGGNYIYMVTQPTAEIAYGMYMRTRDVIRNLQVYSQQCKVLIPPETLDDEMDWEPTINAG